MIRIAIDIDDTITNTNDFLIEEAIKYDKLINGKGFKNKDAYDFTEMFYWSKEDKLNFFKYIKENELLTKLKVKKDFKDVLEKLNEKAEIYFVSARSDKSFKSPHEQTTKWLKDNDIKYKKLFTNVINKSTILKENKIDLFIDDNENNCKEALKTNIDTIIFESNYNKDSKIKRYSNWYQILEYINNFLHNEL